MLSSFRSTAGLAAAVVAAGISLTAIPSSAGAAPAAPVLHVTEHYNGHIFMLTPGHWHGAKDCAIVTPTEAYCFSTGDAMNTFTATSPIATAKPAIPDVSCSGYTKIWNGANWTNIGLAFHDWGYAQNLNSYVQVPFKVLSWFSDGQRGLNGNNCGANIFTGFNATGSALYLPPEAHALNLGSPWNSDSIELYHP